jgi:hypothetical protein
MVCGARRNLTPITGYDGPEHARASLMHGATRFAMDPAMNSCRWDAHKGDKGFAHAWGHWGGTNTRTIAGCRRPRTVSLTTPGPEKYSRGAATIAARATPCGGGRAGSLSNFAP